MNGCLHASAYSCAECNRNFCMECDAPQPDEREIKTAVKWCPHDVAAEAAANGLPLETMLKHRQWRART